MFREEEIQDYEVKSDADRVWTNTRDNFSALYEQKIAFSTAKSRHGVFNSGAHVSDRTTAASTVTTPTTPTNLAHITQTGTIVYHLDAPYVAADYIAAFEE